MSEQLDGITITISVSTLAGPDRPTLIYEDMSRDVLKEASIHNDYLRRRVEDVGETVVSSVVQTNAAFIDATRFRNDHNIPSLFPDEQADLLRGSVLKTAQLIGPATMHRLCLWPRGRKYGIRGSSYYKPKLLLPGVDGDRQEVSIQQFAEEIWPGDYTERFVDAWFEQQPPLINHRVEVTEKEQLNQELTGGAKDIK